MAVPYEDAIPEKGGTEWTGIAIQVEKEEVCPGRNDFQREA